METNHRNPSKHRIEEHRMLNWIKHNRKLMNAGELKLERLEMFRESLAVGERYHWHNTKFEQFIVVKGHGLIQQRNLNDPSGRVLEWEVSGDKIQAVHMLPGYTHNIINLSDTEDLVTVMYCNEVFDPGRPDTFFEAV